VARAASLLALCLVALAACASGAPAGTAPAAGRSGLDSPGAGNAGGFSLPSASVASVAPTDDPTAPPTPRPAAPADPQGPDSTRVYHVPILMFHRVIPVAEADGGASDLVMPPERFAGQKKSLFDAGWHSITMATLVAEMSTNATIPPKTFVPTFDDGWSDGYNYAFPIMRTYGFVGTFYVISSRIDRGSDYLSTVQLRELEAAGNDIGNHTADHLSLSIIGDSQVRLEVEVASAAIGTAVGHRPVSLAYPMGGVSMTTIAIVGQVPDLSAAVTTWPGMTETWRDRYDMPRVRMNPSTDPATLPAMLSAGQIP
jgi:peptidoglycan/xylan/chitin deacetylase (PgdA/CDA1 family)